MNLIDHLINERPVMLARYIVYAVIAIIGVLTSIKAKNKKKR